MYPSDNIFFIFHKESLVCWNYLSHEQYELTDEYLTRLRQINAGQEGFRSDKVDSELFDAGVITNRKKLPKWKWDKLSHIFHVGTQNVLPSDLTAVKEMTFAKYFEHCSSITSTTPEVIIKRDGPVTNLPDPNLADLQRARLWDILLKRRVTREFYRKTVPLSLVSTMLYSVFGAVHGPTRTDLAKFKVKSFGYRRTSPSGGGLQSTEPYLVNFRIEGLSPGSYHYHSLEHKLYKVVAEEELSAQNIGLLTGRQDYAANLAFAVCLVVRFDKLWWKYRSSRAYRIALFDVGHLSQTFHLVSAALSLCTWMSGAIFDQEINKKLGLEAECESCMLVLGAGIGTGEPIGPEIIEGMKNWMGSAADMRS